MFLPYSFDDSHNDAFEYHVADAEMELHVGMALRFDGGVLVPATGATTPEFISMTGNKITAAGEKIAVMRVAKDVVYETELATANETIACGEKYTIDGDGCKITATTGGAAQVVNFDGTASGAKVRVRF